MKRLANELMSNVQDSQIILDGTASLQAFDQYAKVPQVTTSDSARIPEGIKLRNCSIVLMRLEESAIEDLKLISNDTDLQIPNQASTSDTGLENGKCCFYVKKSNIQILIICRRAKWDTCH